MYSIEHYREIKRPEARYKAASRVVIVEGNGAKRVGIVSWIGRKFLHIQDIDDDGTPLAKSFEKYNMDTQRSDAPYSQRVFKTQEQNDYDNQLREAQQKLKKAGLNPVNGLTIIKDGLIFAVADLIDEYSDSWKEGDRA